MAPSPARSADRGRAWITGATGGLGSAFAEELALLGYDLCLVARTKPSLETLANRLQRDYGVRVDVLPLDLTQSESLGIAEEQLAADVRLSLLVNAAGFATWGRFAEMDPQEEEELLRLNVLAVVRLTRAALRRLLIRREGGIINLSSFSALVPLPQAAAYSGSKAFVLGFTQAVREEVRSTGVHVQALCPGFVRTAIFDRARVDVSRSPAWSWSDARLVARTSLAAIRRNRAVCVPGWRYRLLALVARLMPAVAQGILRLLMSMYGPTVLGDVSLPSQAESGTAHSTPRTSPR